VQVASAEPPFYLQWQILGSIGPSDNEVLAAVYSWKFYFLLIILVVQSKSPLNISLSL
jgi:hypothetical protein